MRFDIMKAKLNRKYLTFFFNLKAKARKNL